jgi:hypothetical protein
VRYRYYLMRKIYGAGLVFAASLCAAQQSSDRSIGEVFATDATVQGSVILAGSGTRVGSGSTVSAGRSPASLRLSRGGEVRVCPGTTVNVTAAARSRGLMLSLDSGTVETHYSVGSSSDTIQTPDFRILLPGPGDFNFAISADKRGNTCVRALDSNTASLVVTEMMGEGTYQVRPNEQVTFSDGKVSNAIAFGRCGCAAAPQTLQADQSKPNPSSSTNNAVAQPAPTIASQPERVAPPSAAAPEAQRPAPVPAAPPAANETAPVPASKPDEVHVQVEVPMVYSADTSPAPAAAIPTPTISPAGEPVYLPAAVYFALFRPVMDVPAVAPLPPAGKTQKDKKGFFGKLKSFFGGMFK